jgi:circadian clock protein KaiC
MANTVQKIPSGFSFIDNNWGGMYRGGSYLVVGPRKSGRTLIGLQMALEAAKSSEVCLYFTLMRPKDLMIQAASLNFDIQSYMNQNLIIVVRVAPPNDINDLYNPDEYLVEYLNDIITVVDQYHPARIVFDELTPFVGFKNLEYLKDSFVKTLESIEERDITSMFIISEPATQKAQSIVDGLSEFVTAVILLKKEKNPNGERSQNGVVLISPNVGHNEGQFSSSYRIEPYKGVTTDFTPKTHITEEYAPVMKGTRDYTQITKVEIPSEPYAYSNVYNYTDFLLILNNQIALFKSTGQTFNLISFKLDTAAQIRGLLSLNQLQLAVRLAVSKKDKLCIIDNKVIVLLVRGNLKSVIDLMTNVQNNLPSRESNYVNAVMEFISIFNMEVNEKIDNAENMMENVMSTENSQSKAYQPLNKYIG